MHGIRIARAMHGDSRPSSRTSFVRRDRGTATPLVAALALVVCHAGPALAQATTTRDSLAARRDSQPSGAANAGTPQTVPDASLLPSATTVNAPVPHPNILESTIPTRTDRPGILADTGVYVYELSPTESDDVHAAIEHSIAHMGLIPRQIARHRLARANRPSAHITFAVSPDTLSVTFDGNNPIITPLTGEPVPWVRLTTHDKYEVHVDVAGDTLRQIIAANDGQRENDFVFLDGGTTIEMYVTLQAQHLPTPLHYKEVFREVRAATDQSAVDSNP